jgi:hypothetical protein
MRELLSSRKKSAVKKKGGHFIGPPFSKTVFVLSEDAAMKRSTGATTRSR